MLVQGGSKLEVVRGAATKIAVVPRAGGERLEATNPAVVGIYDSGGSAIAGHGATATIGPEGSVVVSWTPDAALTLGEDLRLALSYDADGLSRTEEVWFDLVRISLACPVDDLVLASIEPDVPKWLAARGLPDASGVILAAWEDVVARIRAAGSRPALITDRHAFTRAAAHRALVLLSATLIQAPGDKYDRKREIHEQEWDRAWGTIGAIRFAPDENPVAKPGRAALPRFHI